MVYVSPTVKQWTVTRQALRQAMTLAHVLLNSLRESQETYRLVLYVAKTILPYAGAANLFARAGSRSVLEFLILLLGAPLALVLNHSKQLKLWVAFGLKSAVLI
jgi:hypothetical protein